MTPLPKLDPAVAQTRVAVRRVLAEIAAGQDRPLVLVALSGGADSLALAAAVAFEAPRAGLRAGAVIVDHGLQEGSGAVAEHAAEQARALGLDPIVVRRVEVPVGDPDGPEAAARAARYAALERARVDLEACAVLTAHTRDDQAEQVLLALARGSGTRALAGIPPRRDAILRPLLGLSRETTERACAAQALEPWSDPHNSDPRYTRVRVRAEILPLIERELGPGVAAALARTAEVAREDADALDAWAEECAQALATRVDGRARVPVAALAALPAAVRGRIVRRLARTEFGAHLSREHTLAVTSLVTDWRGQGPIDVPGISVSRIGTDLVFARRIGSSRTPGGERTAGDPPQPVQ